MIVPPDNLLKLSLGPCYCQRYIKCKADFIVAPSMYYLMSRLEGNYGFFGPNEKSDFHDIVIGFLSRVTRRRVF